MNSERSSRHRNGPLPPLRRGRGRRRRTARGLAFGRNGRARRSDGPVRLRASRPSCTSSRRWTSRRAAPSRSPARTSAASPTASDPAPPQAHRLRLPVLQPAADAVGRGERPAAALDRRREARPGVLQGSDGPRRADRRARATVRRSSRAASSSAWRSRARSWRSRPSCSPTSRRATSTRRRAREILELLRSSTTELGQTMVMVTHDAQAASIADRVLFLADGAIVRELPRSAAARHPRDDDRDLVAHDPRRAQRPFRPQATDDPDRGRDHPRRRDGQRHVRADRLDRQGVQLDLHRRAEGLRRRDHRQGCDEHRTTARMRRRFAESLLAEGAGAARRRGGRGERRRRRAPDRVERQGDRLRRCAEPRLQHPGRRLALQSAHARRRRLAAWAARS